MADVSREDRERAAEARAFFMAQSPELHHWLATGSWREQTEAPYFADEYGQHDRIAQAIATARAEGEAAASQREAVHLALIAELVDAVAGLINVECSCPEGPSYEQAAAEKRLHAAMLLARDATRNVRVIELAECEVDGPIRYLYTREGDGILDDSLNQLEAEALRDAPRGPCTVSVVVRMGGTNG